MKKEILLEEKEVILKEQEKKHIWVLVHLILPLFVLIFLLLAWYKEDKPFEKTLITFFQPLVSIFGFKEVSPAITITVIWAFVVTLDLFLSYRKQFKKNKK